MRKAQNKKLILIRHGETDQNRLGFLQGQSDIPLNDTGRAQAHKLALALRGESITQIWSSPLIRASETADIARQHHDCSITEKSNLKERNFGVMEGLPVEDYRALQASSTCLIEDFSTKGGESARQLLTRIMPVTEQIIKYQGNGTLAVFAHAGVNRAIIGHLLKLDFQQWRQIDQKNCCINSFLFDSDNKIWAHQLNDWAHCSE